MIISQNATAPKRGTWSDVYEQWQKSGSEEKFAKFKQKALIKEINTRDWEWLWSGDKLEVDFMNEDVKLRKEKNYTHEIKTAKRLSKNGIRCIFQEAEISKNGITKSYADLDNGYELKTLRGCSSENTIIGHLKNCSGKVDAKVAVFDNSENLGMSDQELFRLLHKSVAFHRGKVYILNKEENLVFVR